MREPVTPNTSCSHNKSQETDHAYCCASSSRKTNLWGTFQRAHTAGQMCRSDAGIQSRAAQSLTRHRAVSTNVQLAGAVLDRPQGFNPGHTGGQSLWLFLTSCQNTAISQIVGWEKHNQLINNELPFFDQKYKLFPVPIQILKYFH